MVNLAAPAVFVTSQVATPCRYTLAVGTLGGAGVPVQRRSTRTGSTPRPSQVDLDAVPARRPRWRQTSLNQFNPAWPPLHMVFTQNVTITQFWGSSHSPNSYCEQLKLRQDTPNTCLHWHPSWNSNKTLPKMGISRPL